MSDNGEESKPDVNQEAKEEGENKPINIKVKDSSGELHFRVKMTTKFQKIYDAYAEKRQIGVSTFRFFFDGERVNPDTTPEMLDMEEGDAVDVMIQQTGGGWEA